MTTAALRPAPPHLALRGYRGTHRPLLTGPWPPGEILGFRPVNAPALTAPTRFPEPAGRPDEHLVVVEDTACVRFSGIDWTSRHARLEIGPTPAAAADPEVSAALVRAAVDHARRVLDLHRLYGWLTPAAGGSPEPLLAGGFVREAVVPAAGRHLGAPVAREVWGMVRHG